MSYLIYLFYFYICIDCGYVCQIFERNPLCGINYPCGEASHKTNICVPIENHSNSTSQTNYSEHPTASMTMMDLHMNDSSMYEELAMLPTGFRICNQPNTGLWSLILCVFTFFIALFLRKLRQGKFLGKQVLCCMVFVAMVLCNLPLHPHTLVEASSPCTATILYFYNILYIIETSQFLYGNLTCTHCMHTFTTETNQFCMYPL